MDNDVLVLMAAGMVTGFSKFSVGGMGLLILPIIMIAIPGPEALALIVPIYVITDVLAVSIYRERIAWSVLARLLPPALLGVIAGGWFLSGIDADRFTIMLGIIIFAILALGFWLDHRSGKFMLHPLMAYFTGLFAGFVSLIANAAGPIFSLFLVEQKLDKNAYVSTRSWLFLIINISKLPTLYVLGLLNQTTFVTGLYCLPGLAIGAGAGYWLLRRLNLSQFKWLIRGMAALAALKLLLY